MSIANIRRIMDDTDARLHRAKDEDEVRQIGIDHVRALGADLATTAYLRLISEPERTVQQQAEFLQELIAGLFQSIEETFAHHGVRDVALLSDHLEAADVGFVCRLDELFSVVRIGGHA
ncbi:hypothetical protein [Methylobacterium sp. 1030]|uniref:hypothetical protein n=1 Tax=Methylobacterium sp. 1030 TaxID=3156404 RepID=UPI0033956924